MIVTVLFISYGIYKMSEACSVYVLVGALDKTYVTVITRDVYPVQKLLMCKITFMHFQGGKKEMYCVDRPYTRPHFFCFCDNANTYCGSFYNILSWNETAGITETIKSISRSRAFVLLFSNCYVAFRNVSFFFFIFCAP